MKNIIIISAVIFLQNISSIGQSCNDLIKSGTDKVTGRDSKSTKEIYLFSNDGGGFSISCVHVSSSIKALLFIVNEGDVCIDGESNCRVLFRDGSKLSFKNDTDFNCRGAFWTYFGGTYGGYRQLRIFAKKEVETIRIEKRVGFEQVDLTNEASKLLIKTMQCMLGSR